MGDNSVKGDLGDGAHEKEKTVSLASGLSGGRRVGREDTKPRGRTHSKAIVIPSERAEGEVQGVSRRASDSDTRGKPSI